MADTDPPKLPPPAGGKDSVIIGTVPPGGAGEGNVIINSHDGNFNTIFQRGGVAIGRDAKAYGSGISIGAGAGAGMVPPTPEVWLQASILNAYPAMPVEEIVQLLHAVKGKPVEEKHRAFRTFIEKFAKIPEFISSIGDIAAAYVKMTGG